MDYSSALKKIIELKSKFLELKFSFWQGKPGVDTSSFKKIKREIARVKTLVRMQEIEKEGQR